MRPSSIGRGPQSVMRVYPEGAGKCAIMIAVANATKNIKEKNRMKNMKKLLSLLLALV